MKKIIPTSHIGFKILNGKVVPSILQSETGCFGYILSNEKEILKARTGGWMTRTKEAQ